MTETKEAILVTIKAQRGISVKEKIQAHQDVARATGSTYWRTGFTIASPPPLPFSLYAAVARTGKVLYVSEAVDIERYRDKHRPAHPDISPHYYFPFGFPYRTYFRITDLNKLAEPIPIHHLTKARDGTQVKRAPQGYVRIMDPLA